MPTIVYQYGLLPPTKNADLVTDQMRLAHRYRNKLTEIEIQRRETVRKILSTHPDVEPMQAELEALIQQRDEARAAIRASRAASRSRSETKAQRDAVSQFAARCRDLVIKLKEAKRALSEDVSVQEAIAEAEELSRERVRQERAKCGVYWGTYLLQEASADQARTAKLAPKFVPERMGRFQVSVQIQKGISVEDLFKSDTRIQIAPLPDDAYSLERPRGYRRRAARTVLRMRVGSDGRDPVWAEWPMIMHRPIPAGATIKVATVTRRRRDCLRDRWTVSLTVNLEAPVRTAPADGVCALNLGFCKRGDDYRAGYIVGDDGAQHEILAVARDIEALTKSDSIRGFRDKNLNAMRAALWAWRSGTSPDASGTVGIICDTSAGESATLHVERQHQLGDDAETHDHGRTVTSVPDSGLVTMLQQKRRDRTSVEGSATEGSTTDVTDRTSAGDPVTQADSEGTSAEVIGDPMAARLPEWFAKTTTHVHAWRSADRFRHLLRSWSAQRWDGDHIGYNLLVAWNERDEHLECYEANMRSTALRRRRERYRILAAQMAAKYRTIVIDNTDLRDFHRNPNEESDKANIAAIKRMVRWVAGYQLREALVNSFGAERVSKQSAVDVTRRCSDCGVVNDWDRSVSERKHTCTGCGETWDQDANACRNLIKAHRMDETTDRDQKKRPSRSERLRESKSKKAA